ncbi:DNA recombination protein RecN [Helicobacter sp. MIT 14-3879]|uniref:DNA recombination protein RecN n=1 Tax=Helicobacter sp. MIT 14-3879 TaxID=2040649 RepID=UPI000E1EA726|nr:DNA recombination protein RecN [Helicobacter sp. MIT 14-3879]RDU64152.1 DNA recombination protein RecN [Helicobacter sp. MIT 14-3879]
MINRLLIKDSIAFNEVVINPSKGFNVFSGVSGSGKSVLMESILALFGLRDANASLIEASFGHSSINLEDIGIFDNDDLVLSIVKKDKTKYFINNQVFSKKRAKDLFGNYVKYISSHSINELSNENLLKILDSSIKEDEFRILLDSYNNDYKSFIKYKAELERLEDEEKNIIELREFTMFEISQIELVNPKIGEYDELMQVKKDLSKKEKILEKISSLKPIINGMAELINFLNSIDKNKEIFEETLNDIEVIIQQEEEKLESINEDDIENILNRLELLSNIIHKYGSIEGSLEYLAKKKIDLEHYNNISFNKASIQKELDYISKSIYTKAEQIREWREKYLESFIKSLENYCKKLMLNTPRLKLEKIDLGNNGYDLLEIMLGNSNTFSSGEFNRLKLAILCLEIDYSKQSGILILDEIDANLSGSESEGVAQVLALLSRDYQIFAISHQSHMPCFATNHYLIQKSNNGSKITLLDKEGRIQEIARMISGANITSEAISFAREKLQHL